MAQLQRASGRRATWHRLSVGALVGAELVGTAAAGAYLYAELAGSRFFTYLGLLFSEGSVVLAHWRELGLSLLESLPLFSFTLTLASLTALLWSLSLLARHRQSSALKLSARYL